MNIKNLKTMEVIDSEGCDIVKKLQIEFKDHDHLSNRLKKTLYYGKLPKNQRPSLPLTEVAVELFAKAVPKGRLDIVGMDFASSFSRESCISPCSLMLALVYLERLRHKNPEYLQTVSSCDLFLVSMLVASKYLFDDGEEEEVFNDEWAASAHMETKELNRLERNFLSAMNWELFIKPQAFYKALSDMENRIAHWEGSKRGWLTYTDVHILTQKDWLLAHYWNIIMEDILKVAVVSAVAYISAIATLITAATISHQCTTAILLSSSVANPASCNVSSNLPMTLQPALLPEEQEVFDEIPPGQVYYYEEIWHSILTSQIFNSEITTTDVKSENKNDTKDCWNDDAWFKDVFSINKQEVPSENIGRMKLDNRKFSVWNSFQYWPTCCGGVNSFFA